MLILYEINKNMEKTIDEPSMRWYINIRLQNTSAETLEKSHRRMRKDIK